MPRHQLFFSQNKQFSQQRFRATKTPSSSFVSVPWASESSMQISHRINQITPSTSIPIKLALRLPPGARRSRDPAGCEYKQSGWQPRGGMSRAPQGWCPSFQIKGLSQLLRPGFLLAPAVVGRELLFRSRHGLKHFLSLSGTERPKALPLPASMCRCDWLKKWFRSGKRVS